MLPPVLEDHFKNPRRVGRLGSGSLRGRAENPACGDLLELELAIRDGRVADVRFMAHGCSSLIAVASLAASSLPGLGLADARQFDLDGAVARAGGLPRNRRHAISLVSEALRAALSGGGS